MDIWQAAQVLISQHGAQAESVAAKNFVELQKAGDTDGAAIWTAIMIAIQKLRTADATADEPESGAA
ncbi:MAG: hypothetical protein KGJ79_02210 [Alphaproteobacteria bacterium]|nr:hypothetical protein [Alphaproteobacteria bacterium]MDE2109927.1 hypothetical protein [Alphaproteobacteria bacterium]MDE2496080.1 hypothetical protein [Alphaproteobacteria bacterium]